MTIDICQRLLIDGNVICAVGDKELDFVKIML